MARFSALTTHMFRVMPLPVRVEPEPDESGLGALLRSAASNGIGLRYMLAWMGILGLSLKSRDQIAPLAEVAGLPPRWLQNNLRIERSSDGHRWAEWLGRAWTFPPSLRRLRVQYCPRCLRDRPICRSAWEITGAFACERHRTLLQERCPHCRSQVSWDRPAPDICSCGHYLSGSEEQDATEVHLQWVAVLLTLAGIEDRARIVATDLMPRWFYTLSPDGLYATAHAAGVRRGGFAPLPSKLSMYVAAPMEVARVVELGVKRLCEIRELQTPCTIEMRAAFHEEALERLLKRSNVLADRDVTSDLLAWLRDQPKRGASLSGRKVRGQLRLFA